MKKTNERIKSFIVLIMIITMSAYFYQTKTKLGFNFKKSLYFEIKYEGNMTKEKNNEIINILKERLNISGLPNNTIRNVKSNLFTVVINNEYDIKKITTLFDESFPKNSNTEILKGFISPIFIEFQLINDDGTLKKTGINKKDIEKFFLDENQYISFQFNAEGSKKFSKLTRENIGKQLAITLDGVIQTAPIIESEITGGKGVISGAYSEEEKNKLIVLLNLKPLSENVSVITEIKRVNNTNSYIVLLLLLLISFIYLKKNKLLYFNKKI